MSSHRDILFETETFDLKITSLTTFWYIKCRKNLCKYGNNMDNQQCQVILSNISSFFLREVQVFEK